MSQPTTFASLPIGANFARRDGRNGGSYDKISATHARLCSQEGTCQPVAFAPDAKVSATALSTTSAQDAGQTLTSYPPKPEGVTHFQRDYGYQPATVIRWEWSTTFGRWTALVKFEDGSERFTWPKPYPHIAKEPSQPAIAQRILPSFDCSDPMTYLRAALAVLDQNASHNAPQPVRTDIAQARAWIKQAAEILTLSALG